MLGEVGSRETTVGQGTPCCSLRAASHMMGKVGGGHGDITKCWKARCTETPYHNTSTAQCATVGVHSAGDGAADRWRQRGTRREVTTPRDECDGHESQTC